jgi:PAS domain S-box-containing protein
MNEDGQFRLFFENNPLPMWVYDLETLEFLVVNDAAVNVYGYSRDQFLNMRVSDIWPPEDAARSLEEVRKKRPSLDHSGKARHRRKNGMLIKVEIASHTVKYNGRDGELVVAQDITERERAEESLRENEGQYRNIYENATIGIYRTSPEGKILLSNPALIHMLGYSSFEDLASRDLEKAGYAPGYGRDEFRSRIESEGEVKGLESAWTKKNGASVFVRESAKAIRDSDGKVLYYEGTVEDITEHKQAEALQEAIYRIAQAADHSKSLKELFPEIHDIISKVMPANNFYIALHEADRDKIRFPYFVDERAKNMEEEIGPGNGLTAYVLRSGKSLLCTQAVYAELELKGEVKLVGTPTAIWLGVPLIVAGATIGVMVVQHYTDPQAYSVRDQRVLEFVSPQTALAIERKRAEDALRASETNFRSLFENVLDGVYRTSPEGKILAANPALVRMLGYDSATELESINTNHDLYLSPQDHEAERHLLEKTGELRNVEISLKCRDGRVITVLDNVRTVRDEQGDIRYYEGTLTDITERVRVEQDLRGNEERFRTLTQTASDAIITMDILGRIVFWNRAAEKLFGYSAQEAIGQPLALTTPESLRELVQEEFLRVVSMGDIQTNVLAPANERRQLRKDGSEFPAEVSLSTYQTKDGRFVTSIVHDITERKQKEAELELSFSLLSATLESTTDGILVVDRLGKMTSFNRRFVEMWGIPESILSAREDQQALTFVSEQLITPDDFIDKVKNLYERPESKSFDMLEFKDGRIFERYSQPQRLGEQIVGRVWSFRDVTISTRSEQALMESEAELRAVFAAMPDVIMVFDKQGTYLKIATTNPEALYKPEAELLGKRLHEIFPTPKADEFLGYIQAALGNGRPIQFEYALSMGDQTVWFAGTTARMTEDTVVWVGRDISSKKHSDQQVLRRLAELEALYESGFALSQILDPKLIGERVIEVLEKHLNWHHAAVRLVEEGSENVKLLAFSQPKTAKVLKQTGELRAESAVTHIGQGMAGWVIKQGHTINSGDLPNEPRYHETFPGMFSGLYVPIWAGGRVIGVISVESDQPHSFSETDERLLNTLAAQAAAALENSRLFRISVRAAERRTVLYRAGQEIVRVAQNAEEVYAATHRAVAMLMPAEAFTIALLDPERNEINAVYLFDRGGRTPALRIPFGRGLSSKVIISGQPLLIKDDLETAVQAVHYGSPEPVCSIVAVPLRISGKVIGAISAQSYQPNVYTEDDLLLLEMLAAQAAIAVDNGRLFSGLEHANIELTLAYDATIEGWSKALDLRDRETQNHTRRVLDLTLRLAREIGFPETEMPHVRRGVLLHDIGKMGVPDRILNKPGSLDAEEWAIMHEHPQFANDMLSPIDYLLPALDIPYYHHEKWDGSGYPRGLRGEQIPLAARLFSVVDVYDALTSNRPYRPAWSREKALDYIRNEAGKYFDPLVVNAFLKLLDQQI